MNLRVSEETHVIKQDNSVEIYSSIEAALKGVELEKEVLVFERVVISREFIGVKNFGVMDLKPATKNEKLEKAIRKEKIENVKRVMFIDTP